MLRRKEIVAMLNQGQDGVEEFNQYRKEHPNEYIDLSGVSLVDSSLYKVNFAGVCLVKTDLTRCDLAHACLVKADLTLARLVDVDLTGADLQDADLTGATLMRVRNLKREDWERMCEQTARTIHFDC